MGLPHNRGQKIATGLLLVTLCVVPAHASREHSSVKQLAASRRRHEFSFFVQCFLLRPRD